MIPNQKPLRVAVACSGLGHIQRGIEAWAEDTASALQSHAPGVAVTLFGGAPGPGRTGLACWRRTGAMAQRLTAVARRAGGWRYGMGSAYEVEQSSFAASLLRHIRRDFDIVHVQDPTLALHLQRAHRMGLSRPRVILANGTGEGPALLRRFDWLQHLTPAAAAEWQAANLAPPGQRSFTIPNFIDTVRFRPPADAAAKLAARRRLGLPEDVAIILCCAAIRRTHKRIDKLVEAFAALPHPPGQPPAAQRLLLIAGGREAETDGIIAEATARLGPAVRFMVDVPRLQIADLYAAADGFALPSLQELFGIVLLEAMASGLPVLCHDTPSFRHITGPAGQIEDLTGEAGWQRGLLALLDPGQRARLAAAAPGQVAQNFSASAVVPQLLSMYESVAQAEKQP